jgi:hypothetical protein
MRMSLYVVSVEQYDVVIVNLKVAVWTRRNNNFIDRYEDWGADHEAEVCEEKEFVTIVRPTLAIYPRQLSWW